MSAWLRDPQQTATDLNAAAALLEQEGWTQHDYLDETTGCRCAVGAIICALGGESSPSTLPGGVRHRYLNALSALSVQIGIQHSDHAEAVVWWNDERGRDVDQVAQAMRAAATEAAGR